MRISIPFAFQLLLLVACQARAAEPASPKEAIGTWTKECASWTLEQVYDRCFFAQGEKEVTCAKAMAAQTLIICKLQAAVREKWGKEAELAFARAIVTDTLEDDQAATEVVDGDHATVTFKEDTRISVNHLIKIDGKWKADMHVIVQDAGEPIDGFLKFYRDSTRVLQTAMDDLTAGKYKESGQLVAILRAEYEKLDQ